MEGSRVGNIKELYKPETESLLFYSMKIWSTRYGYIILTFYIIFEICIMVLQVSLSRKNVRNLTQTGGYMTKLINAAFQHLQLDPDENSDCGTKYGLEVEIAKSTMLDYHLRYYMKSPKELVLLTEDVLINLIDQKILIRSPVRCLSPLICSKCAGIQYHNMGIMNVGLLLNRISSNVLNKALKKFHDLTIKVSDLDLGNEIKPL